jgi:hypothetical protein
MEDQFSGNFDPHGGGGDAGGGGYYGYEGSEPTGRGRYTPPPPDYKQLLGHAIINQNLLPKWTGEGVGGAYSNAMRMGEILAGIGITDLKQFGRLPDGSFGNKLTGQAVPNTYGDRQTGNFFGGTYEGKGNTGYGVQFGADGTPYFYTVGKSSNDLVKAFEENPLLGTVAQIGAAYFGGPLGSAALNAAMGKSPEDILKSAALSYLGNAAGSAVSGMEGITDVLGETGTNIASNVAKQFVGSGGQNIDPVKVLLSSGLIDGSGDGPNSSDFIEGYFQPGGEGYASSSGGGYESVFDPTYGGELGDVTFNDFNPEPIYTETLPPVIETLPPVIDTAAPPPAGPGYLGGDTGEFMPSPDEDFMPTLPAETQAPTGPGYYDEITGEFIPDENGGLQGPLGPETGNFDPNQKWEYSLTKPGVWTNDAGEEIDLSYMPDRDEAMTGKELMDRAGASLDSFKSGIRPPQGGAAPKPSGQSRPPIRGQVRPPAGGQPRPSTGAQGGAGAGSVAGILAGILGGGAGAALGGVNAGVSKNPAVDAITGLVNQQQQNPLLTMMANDKNEGANIKSYKELFGESLFGDTYVPPSARGYGTDNAPQPQFQSQDDDVEEFFRGGDVTDIDTLLQILRG